MPQKLADNARALLTASILAADTSITIEAGKADLFPVADTDTDPVNTSGKDFFKATLQNTSGDNEIIYVRTRGSGVAILSNVIRAQEGTTALNFAAGSICELRITAQDIENPIAGTFPGDVSVGGNLDVTGTMTQDGVTGGIVPVGGIIMWSGTVAAIPANWQICDGTNSTPDLRDKFVIGARQDDAGAAKTNVTGALTQSGGTKDAINVSHTHALSAASAASGGAHVHGVTDPGHAHTIVGSSGQGGGVAIVVGTAGAWSPDNVTASAATGVAIQSGGAHTHTLSGSTDSSGSSGTNQNLPPYYALAFIRRMA